MSRRTAKIATQAEPADLVSALSEAAGSSASSAPIRATRGASAALLAKEVLPIPTPEHLRPSPTMLLCHDPVVFWLEKLQEDIVRLLDTKDIVRLPSGLRKPLKSSWK